MHERHFILAKIGLGIVLLSAAGTTVAEEPRGETVAATNGEYSVMREAEGLVLRAPDGKPVFRYMTRKPAGSPLTANSTCCLHPVYTPSGIPVTAFAPDDHLHHRGVFLAWYAMRGPKDADFWGWGQFAPTKDRVIENRGIEPIALGQDKADLRIANEWVAEGQVLLREECVTTARKSGPENIIDLTYRLTPAADMKLDRTAFGGFCFRGRKDGKVVYADPDGEVTRPDPHYLKPETVWAPKDWYDYTVTLNDGKTVGLTVIDHPRNGTTGWHNARAVWMVNPCITTAADVPLEKGKPLVLRYRLVAHDGPARRDVLKDLAAEWRSRE